MLRNILLEEGISKAEIDLDDSDVVEPDNDPPQKMGDPSVELTDEAESTALQLKSKAMDKVLEGDLNGAISHLTGAILSNPTSVLYASRALVFVKLKKPNAAIRDAETAIEIKPTLAKAHKALGMARAQLGLWEEAAKDLEVVEDLDFDEEARMIQKKVQSNVKKMEEYLQKYRRLRREKALKNSEDAELASQIREGQVIEVESLSELETRLSAASKLKRLAVLYFTVKWSGPCRYVAPAYERLAAKYPAAMFLKIDLDEVPEAMEVWSIESIPTFYLIKNGGVVYKIDKYDLDLLKKAIAEHA